MNKYFDLDETIFEITNRHPEVIDYLFNYGFAGLKDEALRAKMGKNLSLRMALKSRGLSVDQCEQELIALLDPVSDVDLSLGKELKHQDDENSFKGVLPCPVRIPLAEAFDDFWTKNYNKGLLVELKSANLGLDWLVDEIKEGMCPDVIMSIGLDQFFDQEFRTKYHDSELMYLEQKASNSDFAQLQQSIQDPRSRYRIIGAVPAVLLVNKQVLADLPLPQSFYDLLDPAYDSLVSIPLRDLDLFNAVLLYIYKGRGLEGIKALARSYQQTQHPAEMLKIKIKDTKQAAISIAPYFFASMKSQNSPLEIVWPAEGAVMSPIFLMAKKEASKEAKAVIDFMSSAEVGLIFADNGYFPSTHPEVDNHLPAGYELNWLGFDFIYENDIAKLIQECNQVFQAELKRLGKKIG